MARAALARPAPDGGRNRGCRAPRPGRGGSAHEQTVHHMGQLLLRHAGFPQVLPHQSRRGGHGGRGHGGTGSHGVVIAHISREHVAADAGDLRLQGQAVGGTPGGEAGHLTCKLAGIPNGIYPQKVFVREIGPDEVILQSAGGSHGHLEASQGEMDWHTGRQLLCDRGAVKDYGSRFGLHCLGHDAVCIPAPRRGRT